MRRMRIAVKWLTIGLLAGLLLAPRKGDETRQLLIDRGKEYLQDAFKMAGQGNS